MAANKPYNPVFTAEEVAAMTINTLAEHLVKSLRSAPRGKNCSSMSVSVRIGNRDYQLDMEMVRK